MRITKEYFIIFIMVVFSIGVIVYVFTPTQPIGNGLKNDDELYIQYLNDYLNAYNHTEHNRVTYPHHSPEPISWKQQCLEYKTIASVYRIRINQLNVSTRFDLSRAYFLQYLTATENFYDASMGYNVNVDIPPKAGYVSTERDFQIWDDLGQRKSIMIILRPNIFDTYVCEELKGRSLYPTTKMWFDMYCKK